jgi:anti-anti-sigma regulatory factor
VGKSDKKNQALGDDPLAWLNAGSAADKKTEKKKPASEKKAGKKDKSGKPKSKPNKESKAKKHDNAATDSGKASNQLVLESSMVINKAADFSEVLKKMASSGKAIEIDASKVEIIDSAILQLVFAFVLNLKENDIKFSWHKPTENLLNKASILGLTEQLGL